MVRAEFKKIVQLALSDAKLPGYLSEEVDQALGGIGLDNRRRFATKEQVAAMIRGQAVTFGGAVLADELEAMAEVAKRIDLVN